MRAFVEEGMRQLDIPGVGWRLIDGGRIVFVGGSGVRERTLLRDAQHDCPFVER